MIRVVRVHYKGPQFISMPKGPWAEGTHPFGIGSFAISKQLNDIINH
jgi:hypothetical protein